MARKNPGRLNYGTPGAGSTTHLGAELLRREAGFEMQHVGMKGSAPAHTELMSRSLGNALWPERCIHGLLPVSLTPC